MGENRGSWFPRQQFDWQPPNLNNLYAPFHMEHHHTMPSLVRTGADMVSIKRTLPMYPSLEAPNSNFDRANETHGWFYCLPRFRQALTPTANFDGEEKLITAPCDSKEKSITPKVEPGSFQKKFLVFDQSGDQTTLIFSSGTGTPVPCISFWDSKPTSASNLKREEYGTKENLNIHSGAVAADQFGEKGADLQSEMHEDTDELNALLYSDDDSDDAEDDEVNSTGHSPSAMTDYNNQGWFNGSTEEVASSDGSTKKRKLSDGGYETPALMDTASSVKSIRNFEYEDDAESRCDKRMNWASVYIASDSTNKNIRKERIRDTVNVLQNIIPGGKGKEAIVVLDEAINYLKTLKLKVKALGLDTAP